MKISEVNIIVALGDKNDLNGGGAKIWVSELIYTPESGINLSVNR